jgi:hypothetical protein
MMLDGTERVRDARGGIKLGAMALAVVDRQAMARVTLLACDRERRRGIEPAGEKDYGGRIQRSDASLRRAFAAASLLG